MLDLLLGISLLLWNRLMLRVGLRKAVNGWRRGAGLVLRGESARFVLSAFSLDVFSDEASKENRPVDEVERHVCERLAGFLKSEAEFFILVRRDPKRDRVARYSSVTYSLGFQPWVEGAGRFVRPDTWEGVGPVPVVVGVLPVFEFVCRIKDRCADLWVRVNHVAADGVPVQEMFSRLEKAWGVTGPLVVPSREGFEPFTAARFSPGREGTVEVQTFIDFRPLMEWRRQQNAKLPEPITFGAAMMWWLARHEVFSKLYLGTTVELPKQDGIGGGVGVVVVHPAEYFDRADGLTQYVRAFNRELALTRRRESEGCRTLDAAAFLPARLERKLLHHALNEGTRAFGSVGLTILKDAKVFGAPLGDTGHVDGFIAVGSVGLETSDGERVGCVVVKGPREKIAAYASVLREALELPQNKREISNLMGHHGIFLQSMLRRSVDFRDAGH